MRQKTQAVPVPDTLGSRTSSSKRTRKWEAGRFRVFFILLRASLNLLETNSDSQIMMTRRMVASFAGSAVWLRPLDAAVAAGQFNELVGVAGRHMPSTFDFLVQSVQDDAGPQR